MTTNEEITVDYESISQGPIKDKFLWTNFSVLPSFIFLSILEVPAIVLGIIFITQLMLKLIIMLCLIPFVIWLGTLPYGVRLRINLLNKNFSIRKKTILFFFLGCYTKVYLLEEIENFSLEKVEVLANRHYFYYIHLKNGGEKKLIVGGKDTSINVGFNSEIDQILDFLNFWLTHSN